MIAPLVSSNTSYLGYSVLYTVTSMMIPAQKPTLPPRGEQGATDLMSG